MFDESFGHSRDLDGEAGLQVWRPPVDIYETADGIVLAVELPGVNKENVSVEVKNDVLTLKGQRLPNPDISEDDYYRRERLYGQFKRAFTLDQNVQPELINATFKDGILEIGIPRPVKPQPNQVKIKVD
jgi:HSP20 family protein